MNMLSQLILESGDEKLITKLVDGISKSTHPNKMLTLSMYVSRVCTTMSHAVFVRIMY